MQAPTVQETLKAKDFADIPIFDGDLGRFPDWADRMGAKLVRAHPEMAAILEWPIIGHHGAGGAGEQRARSEHHPHLQHAL